LIDLCVSQSSAKRLKISHKKGVRIVSCLIQISGLGVPIPRTRQQPHTDMPYIPPVTAKYMQSAQVLLPTLSPWKFKPPSSRFEDKISITPLLKNNGQGL
jgi:hypothetical protein